MASRKVLHTKQPSITSFFFNAKQSTPQQGLHQQQQRELFTDSFIKSKKVKLEQYSTYKKDDENTLPIKNCISPEQKQRMELHKKEAEKKLRLKLFQEVKISEGWQDVINIEFQKTYFKNLQQFVAEQRKTKVIYPPENEVYSWTQHFNINETKVVILGQDPYHGPGQAHGLCFSVKPGVPPPPSLVNMYKELSNDIPGFKTPNHGFLLGWAKQGVLLLNAVLTVEKGLANSHKDKGWEKFTDAIIHWINDNLKGVVFILWGGYAQKKGSFINKSSHLVLSGMHPSPLSAHRGFFGCKHFSKANQYLRENNKQEIDWCCLPLE
ncbi:uracil-DNA glycosylase isoform X1 [Hydra vulgaris]|uniref:Uracil-DNA glycosylase n=1 Tax=Hydra vulgaris TaxID=6087 RepID=T2MGZ2_HYDVU|nr:uracil-DNA glycosylase isoform X1 [Hydra vulgaris]